MSSLGQALAGHLIALDVPESLRSQLHYGDAFPDGRGEWPPRTGCSESPDLAIVRMWTDIDLAEWVHRIPAVFGPHRAGELAGLIAVSARLRSAGEGAKVLWGIDIVPPNQWVDHHSTGLAVSELVFYGPHLNCNLVYGIDAPLNAIGWKPSTDQANRPCTVNNTPCFETSWHEADSSSSRPDPANPITGAGSRKAQQDKGVGE